MALELMAKEFRTQGNAKKEFSEVQFRKGHVRRSGDYSRSKVISPLVSSDRNCELYLEVNINFYDSSGIGSV